LIRAGYRFAIAILNIAGRTRDWNANEIAALLKRDCMIGAANLEMRAVRMSDG
jgi:hypothetical protein